VVHGVFDPGNSSMDSNKTVPLKVVGLYPLSLSTWFGNNLSDEFGAPIPKQVNKSACKTNLQVLFSSLREAYTAHMSQSLIIIVTTAFAAKNRLNDSTSIE
jgi:hypothetical protein